MKYYDRVTATAGAAIMTSDNAVNSTTRCVFAAFKWLCLLGMFVAVSFSGAAHAQYSGYYVGLFSGNVDVDTTLAYLVDITPPSATVPELAVVYGPARGDTDLDGLVIGYQFNDNFEVQIGYLSPEDFEDQWAEPGFEPVSRGLSISGFNFGGVAKYPIMRRWHVFGTFGLMQLDVDVDIRSLVSPGAVTYSQNSSGLYYGAGTLVELTRQFALSAEYKFIRISAGNFFDDVDMDGLTVGLQFSF